MEKPTITSIVCIIIFAIFATFVLAYIFRDQIVMVIDYLWSLRGGNLIKIDS